MRQIITKWIGAYINAMSHIVPGSAGKFGFRIFGRPVRRRVKPGERKFLDSSGRFTFIHRDIRISGYRWGSGEKKILLLHGWQSHSGRWKQLVNALHGHGFTIYAFDAPGHGFSEGKLFTAPLYGDVIFRFGREAGPFHTIAGHSLGAFSALYAISHFRQLKAGRLVIMATPGEVKDFVTYFRQRLSLNKKSLDAIRSHFETEFGRPYEEFSITKFAEHLDVPGLIIHDKTDKFAPYKYAEQLHEKWRGSRLAATDNLGHNLLSHEVTQMVLNYILDETEEGAANEITQLQVSKENQKNKTQT
jgi:pimeloyl-ACP methyl ester carboxylesterase